MKSIVINFSLLIKNIFLKIAIKITIQKIKELISNVSGKKKLTNSAKNETIINPNIISSQILLELFFLENLLILPIKNEK